MSCSAHIPPPCMTTPPVQRRCKSPMQLSPARLHSKSLRCSPVNSLHASSKDHQVFLPRMPANIIHENCVVDVMQNESILHRRHSHLPPMEFEILCPRVRKR